MIAYLEGTIIQTGEDRVVLLAGGVGYEVLLPVVVKTGLKQQEIGHQVAFHIYHYQTERQPRPVLIGFNTLPEKAFFQQFISVADIGPLKAVKALEIPVEEIATAIEARDIPRLCRLKGIGKRTAEKMVASLAGKLEAFTIDYPFSRTAETVPDADFVKDAEQALMTQLGYKSIEAKMLIQEALRQHPDVNSAGALVEVIFQNRD
jgi:Holliday junction DNA helicase RuvA